MMQDLIVEFQPQSIKGRLMATRITKKYHAPNSKSQRIVGLMVSEKREYSIFFGCDQVKCCVDMLI